MKEITMTSFHLATALAILSPFAVRGAPVGRFDFDEGQGQLALDQSSAENHATLGRHPKPEPRDPRWVAEGKHGAALEFDGKDDVVSIPTTTSLIPCRGLEVEAWVYQRKRTPYARVFDKRPCFDMYIHADGIPAFRFRGAEAHGVRGKEPVPLNQWVHLKGSYDGQTMGLFVNGEEVATRPYADPIPNKGHESMGDLFIGNGPFPRPFCGMIDEVRITNIGYELLATEPFLPDADTVGLWHLDDPGRADDAGPGGLHGQVHGAARTDGKIGGALRFDGNAFVQIPHLSSLDLQDELTIDCWVKQTQRSPYARIVEKDDWTYGLWITSRGHADFFYRPEGGGTSHTFSNVELPLRRWVHVRAEFDGLETIIYFDGREVARDPVPDTKQRIVKSDGALFMGNRRLRDRGFIGLIDEVRISRVVRRPRPLLRAWLVPYPSKNRWDLRVDTRGSRGRAASVHGSVRAKGHTEALREIKIPELMRGLGRLQMAGSSFAPGDYRFSLIALDANGIRVAETAMDFKKPAKPDWLGANTGVSNDVLPPWTPITVEQDGEGEVGLSCWGRKYSFIGSPLPSQITSVGAGLLAGPIRLVVAKASQGEGRVRVTAAEEHRARLSGSIATGAVRAKVDATFEFDGLARFDVTLGPSAPDSAYIEIPLDAKHATLMHYPGTWFQDPTCAGALPKTGWRKPNTWYLWLGDEERGLCWFAEDQAAWGLDPERSGIEAIPDGDAVRLRVWLVNTATTLREPRTFTWGLMATPVKPRPKGWQRWRFGSPNGPVTIGVRWSTLSSSKWHSFPVPSSPAAYRADVQRAQAAGKKFIPYTNFNMQSDTGDEWRYWGQEWNAHAGEGKAADVLAMNVINVRCCAMTPSWCDFITWKYQRFLEDYDSDGFYLDNSMPGRCNNPDHSAHHHGRRHIFAARELMKRMYTVTKRNDPDNVMVCHMSSRLCIPVLSFCDAIVDGEQYGWALDDQFDAHYMPITPLDRVRAELMAHQWGPVPLFLPCNRGPNPWTPKLMRELLALMLPHGMRFWLSGHRATMVRVLDVVDAFGLDDARFVPYWSVPKWRRIADEEGWVVSAYAKEGRALLLVSNLREQPRTLGLDLSVLGLKARPVAIDDPLDHSPVSCEGPQLTVGAEGRDLRVVLVRH